LGLVSLTDGRLRRCACALRAADNIDYNSLKHHIKAHTTKDQATAIAIPGRPNTALQKFEDEFYEELCRQHDRVGMFVASKADEIARRLRMFPAVPCSLPHACTVETIG
jgi:hypothetical protein